ncbi:MAG: hypothetical protein HC841_02275, partial [Verrucomicrobiae bacterium]|nr:hypothetical protein [Verrucomicrobiae bacterium]
MAYVVSLALVLLSLYAHLLTAGLKQPLAYAALAATTAVALAALGVWTLIRAERGGASRAQLAADAARHIAFVWIFSALALFLVYGNLLKWREWLTFGVGMSVVGALSYGLAIVFA